ncbi:MAG: thiamine pyrophosphate-binding protein [Clostridia bacterium]|nr:thiamine pyrophosphate-binding protein [Clostridia bacterium]
MIFHSTYNKPILLVGNGARTSGASDLILEFGKKTNIPIITTMMGVDLAQDDNHLGFIGTHGNRVANMIINECDLIISIGARLGLRQVGRYTQNFAPKADLIRCDIDEYELSRNIKNNEKKYQIDARDFLTMLLNEDIPDYRVWKEQCFDAKRILDNYDKTEGNLVIEKISSLLPENPIVAVDVGQNQCWAAQSLVLKGNEGRILIGGGYGTMGCGLPYAIGASIANNNLVYCICGDGGFQMNIQELETVKREKLPVKIFVLNNKVLGKISETQHTNHNDRYAQTTAASGYTVPDFEKISEAYGIRAATLESYQQLDEYQDWFCDENPCLFNIMMSEESYLVPKIKWETGVMKPDLPDEIISRCKSILSQ